jgi:abequosyltransferase
MGIKLSICIPTYNRAKFLPDLLDSIVKQIDDSNKNIIEVVISDNASKDNTKEVIDSYRSKIPNLVYFRWDENKGADRNFIKVVELASGDYCWLMGSDDVIEDGSINYVLNFLEKNKNISGISLNRNAYDFELKFKIKERPVGGFYFKENFVLKDVNLIFKYFFYYFGYISGQVVNRRLWNQVLEENKGAIANYFNAYVHVYLISKMILKNPLWGYINEKLVNSRGGNDSFLSELGVLKRMYIDIMGYEKISGDVLGRDNLLYKSLNEKILKILVRNHVLNIKFNSDLGYRNLLEILKICFKYYKKYLYFYYFVLPLLITPTFFLKIVRFVYRKTIKKIVNKANKQDE